MELKIDELCKKYPNLKELIEVNVAALDPLFKELTNKIKATIVVAYLQGCYDTTGEIEEKQDTSLVENFIHPDYMN